MATRVKLELDTETFGRLMESAVAEQRPADWQAEVILRRALGTWNEPRTGFEVRVTNPSLQPGPAGHKSASVPA
jgi:hypothetical protein